MSLSRVSTVTATGTGTTAGMFADGDSVLILTSNTWGSASIEISVDNVTFVPLESSSGPIVVTSNKGIFIYGGVFYRLNVSSWSANIVAQINRLMK